MYIRQLRALFLYKGIDCAAPGHNLVLVLALILPQRGIGRGEHKREGERLLRKKGRIIRKNFIQSNE